MKGGGIDMKRFLIILVIAVVSMFWNCGQNAYAYCMPSSQPEPTQEVASLPGAPGKTIGNLTEISDAFDRGESKTETIYLKKGQSYWVSAAGCPRAGNIKISLIKDEKVLAEDTNYSPNFCFKAEETGNHTFKTKLISTEHGDWGNVKARMVQLSEQCM